MKNKRTIIIAGFALLLMVVGGLSMSTLAMAGSKRMVLVDSSGNTVHQVALMNDKMSPDSLTIPVGQTVQFNTADGLKHDIGFGAGGDHHQEDNNYASGEFGVGESWRVTFKKVGSYQLHDHEHANMNILVVVYQPKK